MSDLSGLSQFCYFSVQGSLEQVSLNESTCFNSTNYCIVDAVDNTRYCCKNCGLQKLDILDNFLDISTETTD